MTLKWGDYLEISGWAQGNLKGLPKVEEGNRKGDDSEIFEDATLLVMKIEEGAICHRMQACRSWKRQ